LPIDRRRQAGLSEKGGSMDDMNEKERHDTKMATLYELRLTISQSNKDTYTKEEILQMLDTVAMAKDQK
jgi:hypothetical protein